MVIYYFFQVKIEDSVTEEERLVVREQIEREKEEEKKKAHLDKEKIGDWQLMSRQSSVALVCFFSSRFDFHF